MPASKPLPNPSPVAIKRLPWMRRLSFVSPKASRLITLFSYESLNLWSFIESHSAITRFCEYPGYVFAGDKRMLATFLVEGLQTRQYLVLQDDIELVPEHPQRVSTFTQTDVFTVTKEWIDPHRQWIQNWQQINPYIVSNGRYVTPQMLAMVALLFSNPMALFDAEQALQRQMERQLARTAIFMLLHQGKLASDDLKTQALSGATVFRAAISGIQRSVT